MLHGQQTVLDMQVIVGDVSGRKRRGSGLREKSHCRVWTSSSVLFRGEKLRKSDHKDDRQQDFQVIAGLSLLLASSESCNILTSVVVEVN